MSSTPAAMAADKFNLAGGDAEFGSRSKNVFACLESLEAKHIAFEKTDAVRVEGASLLKADPIDDTPFLQPPKHDSATFVTPALPPPKKKLRRGVPDFASNPSHWKMYDLSDVSSVQLSESSNVRAAQDFLDSRLLGTSEEGSKDFAEEEETGIGFSAASIHRHVFRKPKVAPKDSDEKQASEMNPAARKAKQLVGVDYDEDDAGLTLKDDALPSEDLSTVFVQRGRMDKRLVRHKGSDEDDDEKTDEGDNKDLTGKPKYTESNDSDSDDFSELAQLGSASEEDDDDDDVGQENEEQPVDDISDGQTTSEEHSNSDIVDATCEHDADLEKVD